MRDEALREDNNLLDPRKPFDLRADKCALYMHYVLILDQTQSIPIFRL
jgi:hypothetical protein